VLAELGAAKKLVPYVFTKTDAVPPQLLEAQKALAASLMPNSVFVSALRIETLEPLRQALADGSCAGDCLADIRLWSGDAKLLAQIHRETEVLSQTVEDGQILLREGLCEPRSSQTGRWKTSRIWSMMCLRNGKRRIRPKSEGAREEKEHDYPATLRFAAVIICLDRIPLPV
jgi:hypothetical protein